VGLRIRILAISGAFRIVSVPGSGNTLRYWFALLRRYCSPGGGGGGKDFFLTNRRCGGYPSRLLT
jgi:hypothetical protein